MKTRPSSERSTSFRTMVGWKDRMKVISASLRWSATGDGRMSQPPASSMESAERMEWRMLRWVRRGNATVEEGEEAYSGV